MFSRKGKERDLINADDKTAVIMNVNDEIIMALENEWLNARIPILTPQSHVSQNQKSTFYRLMKHPLLNECVSKRRVNPLALCMCKKDYLLCYAKMPGLGIVRVENGKWEAVLAYYKGSGCNGEKMSLLYQFERWRGDSISEFLNAREFSREWEVYGPSLSRDEMRTFEEAIIYISTVWKKEEEEEPVGPPDHRNNGSSSSSF